MAGVISDPIPSPSIKGIIGWLGTSILPLLLIVIGFALVGFFLFSWL